MSPHTLLTTAEVAAALRCSIDTVQRRIANGSLSAVRIGGRWLVAREVVEQLHEAAKAR